MTCRTLPLAACALVLIVPGSIAAYDLGRPEMRMIAGEIGMADVAVSRPEMGISLAGWDGGTWQVPPATLVPLTLFNVNSRELQQFQVLPSGTAAGDPQALEQFFRCKRSGRSHAMAPGVIAVLADVASRWPDHTIEIVSGFRRRGTGARRSKHYTGHAIDFRVRGVPLPELRDYVWSRHESIGLGHYHGDDFLHVDYRPEEPKIGWNQRRNRARYSYHPSWTR